MRYAGAGAFRTALEQRLLRQSEQTAVPLLRLRKLAVFDRLLARLMVAAPDRWILKGAVALHYRVGPTFRTTRDLDLGRQDDEQVATTDFHRAYSVDLGDYSVFSIQRTTKRDTLRDGIAVRYHLTAHVDGHPFEDVTIDVGFGDPPVSAPDTLRGPDLLSFAEIPPVEVPSCPWSSTLPRSSTPTRGPTRAVRPVPGSRISSTFRSSVPFSPLKSGVCGLRSVRPSMHRAVSNSPQSSHRLHRSGVRRFTA